MHFKHIPSVVFDKKELKSINKREPGKKGRPSKDEILKTYDQNRKSMILSLKEMEKMGTFRILFKFKGEILEPKNFK